VFPEEKKKRNSYCISLDEFRKSFVDVKDLRRPINYSHIATLFIHVVLVSSKKERRRSREKAWCFCWQQLTPALLISSFHSSCFSPSFSDSKVSGTTDSIQLSLLSTWTSNNPLSTWSWVRKQNLSLLEVEPDAHLICTFSLFLIKTGGFGVLLTALVAALAQRAATHRLFERRQDLTYLSDSLAAWVGPFAALKSLLNHATEQIKQNKLTVELVFISIYLVICALMGAIFTSIFTLGVYDTRWVCRILEDYTDL